MCPNRRVQVCAPASTVEMMTTPVALLSLAGRSLCGMPLMARGRHRIVPGCYASDAAPLIAVRGRERVVPSRHASDAALQAQALLIFDELNDSAFDGALPAVTLRWNRRLRRTAGRCHFISCGTDARSATIELSPRVLDSTERLKLTLAHEMCHAAQWLLDGNCKPPHGPVFQSWARHVERRVPELRITTRHTFEVHTRYRYSCMSCGQAYGRHSRSIDLRARACQCGGALRFDGAFDRSGKPLHPVPAPAFAAFVQTEYAALRARWPRVTHQRIMQELGKRWRRLPATKRKGGGCARGNRHRDS